MHTRIYTHIQTSICIYTYNTHAYIYIYLYISNIYMYTWPRNSCTHMHALLVLHTTYIYMEREGERESESEREREREKRVDERVSKWVREGGRWVDDHENGSSGKIHWAFPQVGDTFLLISATIVSVINRWCYGLRFSSAQTDHSVMNHTVCQMA